MSDETPWQQPGEQQPQGPPPWQPPGPQDPQQPGYAASAPLFGQPGQPAYGGQYGQPPYAGPPPKTNALAIASLVCSCVGIFCGIAAIVGIVLGFVARSSIRKSNGAEKGDGLALAGIIVGFVVIALSILWIVFVVANSNSSSSSLGLLLPQ
jgi:hypothetical protein